MEIRISAKRIRRSAAVKTLAFLLACACLCAIVYQGIWLEVSDKFDDFYTGLIALFNPDYTYSSQFAGIADDTMYTLLSAVTSGTGLSADERALLDERAYYYASHSPLRASGSVPDTVISNTDMRSADDFMSASNYFFSYENGDIISSAPTRSYFDFAGIAGDLVVYVAFLPEYIGERQHQWQDYYGTYAGDTLLQFALLGATALLCIIYLSIVTGRRPRSEELFLSPVDSIYSDILLVLLVCFGLAFVGLNVLAVDEIGTSRRTLPLLCTAITALLSPCIIMLWLSLLRKIKARKLIRHTLIFSSMHGVYRFFRATFRMLRRFFTELFSGRRFSGYPLARALFVRQMVFISLSFSMVCGFVIALGMGWAYVCVFAVIAELALVYYYVKVNNATFADIEKLNVQIYQISEGNMGFDPEITGDSQLREISARLLDIGGGMQAALDRQLASERMKIALVTNVSHDLKTPLTSIIGYIDLLRRDEALSAESRDYVGILAKKSQRLKTIIDDLFDLAKTSSGDESALSMELLDLRRLIEQTLADMDDKITASGQLVRTRLPGGPVFVRADGRRLYRVIQNIVDNALKYSMPDTRIYISLIGGDGTARVVFKNTASYEMDFTAEEILERFVRGDKSRTTEGSGLGLSIAAGFTGAMNGDLSVNIDGDQFTVELAFAVAAPPNEPEPEELDEPTPAQAGTRLDALRGKLYRPQNGVPPIPVVARPATDDSPQGRASNDIREQITKPFNVSIAMRLFRDDGSQAGHSDVPDDEVEPPDD